MARNDDIISNLSRVERVLVTGGLGFIGGHLVDMLLERDPHRHVVVADAATYAANPALQARYAAEPRVTLLIGDVADRAFAMRAVEDCHTVFHCAAETHVPRSFANEALFFRTNVEGTDSVCQAALSQGVVRLVHMSTDEVYGPTAEAVGESAPRRPTTPYAASKAEAERKVLQAHERGLDCCIVRPVNAIGTRQHAEKVLPTFARLAVSGEPLTIEGNGDQRRCFLPVDDLVAALLLVCERGESGGIYNIPAAEELTILELADRLATTAGSRAGIRFVADRAVNDSSYRLRGERLQALGYRQSSTVDDVLKAVVREAECARAAGRMTASPALAPDHADLADDDREIAFHQPHRAAGESRYIQKVVDNGQYAAGGGFSRIAGRELSQRLNGARVELTHSCTAALEIAAIAADLQPGDEVVMPTYTFAATATAFARTGASVVPCDISAETMMLTAETAAAAMTSRTKALVVVHYGGAVADMPPIIDLCRRRGVLLIEDAAQAMGVAGHGRPAGTFGDLGCFSFHQTKIIHSGQGGALVVNTRDPDRLRKVAEALDRGTNFAEFKRGAVECYEWTGHGSSFRPTEMQAALLSAQLDDLDAVIAHRRAIIDRYAERLDMPLLACCTAPGSNGHIAATLAPDAPMARDIMAIGRRLGISFSGHYKPLHLSAGFRDVRPRLPIAEMVWNRLVRLPVHTGMTLADADRVAEVFNTCLQREAA